MHSKGTLWERRLKGARAAICDVACSVPATTALYGNVEPYRTWVFSQAPTHVSAGVEICQSETFPSQLYKLMLVDVVAEGVGVDVIERILADAREMLPGLELEHKDRKKSVLYSMISRPMSPEATAQLTPSTIEHMESYPHMAGVYLLFGPTHHSGAVVMHLRPCARPAGDRRNATLCVAAHYHAGEAVALAATALLLSNLEEKLRIANQALRPPPPPIPGEVNPTVLGAARFFFTARISRDLDVKTRYVRTPPSCLVKFAHRRFRTAVEESEHVGP